MVNITTAIMNVRLLGLVPGLALVAALSLAAGTASAQDKDKLQGKWKLASIEVGGAVQPDDDIKDSDKIIDFKDDKVISTNDGQTETDSFTLDETTSPKQLSIKETKSGNTLKFIYKLDGDTLQMCGDADPQGDYPREFKTNKDKPSVMLITLKRVR